jgi:Zn-dependent M28 family amino/carboxypeptidase
MIKEPKTLLQSAMKSWDSNYPTHQSVWGLLALSHCNHNKYHELFPFVFDTVVWFSRHYWACLYHVGDGRTLKHTRDENNYILYIIKL